ncbi:2OG-Fe(II) oxygenase [Mucilaginibacter litoreus]|uniref:2OG-Fe(II) oxygenase n=1 Tax=Mucilaginibacter litoreus TaxID=1048221 RepID=A0ABW3ATB6_9SPHI
MNLHQHIKNINWNGVTECMNAKGYALIPGLLSSEGCDEMIALYPDEKNYRKTIQMENHGYGIGQYKYFSYPLPGVVQQIRKDIYPYISVIANHWMHVLGLNTLPASFNELNALCHQHGQLRPTPLILKYNKGGFNALHQDLYGQIYFPMQLVICLNQTGADFCGGEFVLVEQKPRMQSKASVINLNKGDALLFTTNYRPVKSVKGYYRANMRHGVIEITSGERYTLGIIFHDAI